MLICNCQIHFGVIQECEVVRNNPPALKRRVMRLVSGKVLVVGLSLCMLFSCCCRPRWQLGSTRLELTQQGQQGKQ
jgi:hypothetical protein